MIGLMRIYLKLFYVIIIYYMVYSYSSKNCFNKLKLTDFNNKTTHIICRDKPNIKCVIYNLRRLPYLLVDTNIDNIVYNYDICILQEYFNDLFFRRNRYLKNTNKFFNSGGKNIISSKLIDSGLVTTANHSLEYVDCIQFKKYKNVDRFANKSFLISKLKISGDHILYIINTHLQNFYTVEEYNCDIISDQLKSIDNYICINILRYAKKSHSISLIVAGDFNRNLKDIVWSIEPTQIIYSKTPTIWDNRIGLVSMSTPKQVDKTQYPYWTDGGFLWSNSFKVDNISNVVIDKHTDHCGIEFELKSIEPI